MKVSKLALGLALAAGFGMASPSLAQKNKKQEAAAPAAWAPQLGKPFRNAAAPLQKAIQAKDYATAALALNRQALVHEDIRLVIHAIGNSNDVPRRRAIDG